MSADRWRSSRVCVGLHSAPVRRSFDKEMGATRVVVVMFSPCRRPRKRQRTCGLPRWDGRNRFGGFCQNEFKEAEKFANLHTGDDKGREEPQCKVVGAIYQQALTQGFGHEGIAVNVKLNSKNQAFAADFANEIKFGGELG